MTIYIILALVMLFLSLKRPKDRIASLFVVFIFSYLSFFRSHNVGTDVDGYSINFNKMTDNPLSWNYFTPFEIGFNYIILFIKNFISTNPMICWGMMGVFYVVSAYKFYLKNSREVNVALLFFLLFGTYMLSFNIMRQCFGLSFVFLMFSCFDLEKLTGKEITICTIAIILIGYLFHPTILILLVLLLYYIPFVQRLLTKKIVISCLVLSFFIFASGIITTLVMDFVSSFSVQGKLVSYAIRNASLNEDSNFSLSKAFLLTVLQIYLVYIKEGKIDIFLFAGVVGVLFLNLFVPLVVEFARVYEILNAFNLVCIANTWSTKHSLPVDKYTKFVLISIAFLLFFNILIKNYGQIVPYEFRIWN